MTNDLLGEVLWLLWKWEIPSLGAFLYLSVRPIVLAFLFFYSSFLTYFVVSNHSELENHHQG